MVGATASTHDGGEGWDNFLFVYTEYSHRQEPTTMQHGPVILEKKKAYTTQPQAILYN